MTNKRRRQKLAKELRANYPGFFSYAESHSFVKAKESSNVFPWCESRGYDIEIVLSTEMGVEIEQYRITIRGNTKDFYSKVAD